MTGGSVIKGESSRQTIEREAMEELGIKLNIEKAQLLKRIKSDNVWIDTYFIKQDIDLQKIYCNDILIWQKYTNSSGAVSGYFSFEFSTSMIANSASPGDKNETYSRGTMSGDVLSWGSKGAIVKANCDCKVTVSGWLSVGAQDGPKAYKAYYYKNNSIVSNFAYAYLSSVGASRTETLKYTINLKKGETFSVQVGQAESSKGRLGCSSNITFVGEPV